MRRSTRSSPVGGERTVGDMGHKGGLTNPRPGRGQCRAGPSDTGGSPMPRKRAPCQKKMLNGKT